MVATLPHLCDHDAHGNHFGGRVVVRENTENKQTKQKQKCILPFVAFLA